MSNSFYRLLKLADVAYDSEDVKAIRIVEAQFNAYAKKYCVAHYRPHNNGNTPNPWRKQMDYASWENSPYYGSISEFMEKFPGGIPDWRQWREKIKKERNQMWSEGPTKGETGLKKASRQERMKRVMDLTGISKNAHYVLEGPDDVEKFEKEPLLYSNEGLEKTKSVEEFKEKRKNWREQDAKDMSKDVVREFINYWKLLMKVPERRKKSRKKK